MASEVGTMTRKRRKFTDEFKAETVRLVNEGPRSIAEVARDLDLTEFAVRHWVSRLFGVYRSPRSDDRPASRGCRCCRYRA